MRTTTTTTTTTTTVPRGVDLSAERHDELVSIMTAGRSVTATLAEQRASLLAGNALLTAYWTIIMRRARASLKGEAAADRAGEAGVRAVVAIRSYDPTCGASLMTFFGSQHVWSGEAVTVAGLPVGVPSSRADRRIAWQAGDGVASVLSLDADPEVGANLADAFSGAGSFELAQDLAVAMRTLSERDRAWMAAAYGLGGVPETSTEALAAAAGVSVHTVRRALAKGLDTLRLQAPTLAFAS